MDLQATILREVNFFTFCSAGMAATCLAHPMDLIKTRMQLNNSKTTIRTEISSILRNGGVPALYSGLSATLFRHAAYTTTRLGMYTWMIDLALRKCYPDTADIWAIEIVLGTLTACISSFAWSPVELAFVRMAADSRLSVEQRRNYKHVFDAMIRISREEGFFTLWRGAFLTTGYMIAANVMHLVSCIFAGPLAMTSVYSDEGPSIAIVWMLLLSVPPMVTAAIITPIDVIKTKYMRTTSERPAYSGTLDALTDIIHQEGSFALWKGFLPQCARVLLYFYSTPLFIAILHIAFEAK